MTGTLTTGLACSRGESTSDGGLVSGLQLIAAFSCCSCSNIYETVRAKLMFSPAVPREDQEQKAAAAAAAAAVLILIVMVVIAFTRAPE